MKKPVIVLFLLCFFFTSPGVHAQLWKMRRIEATAGLGPTLFFGDVGGFSKGENILGLKDMSFLQTRYDVNLSLKYRIIEEFKVRLSMSYGSLHATDKRGSNEARGYEASIFIFEPVLLGEYSFVKNQAENSYLFTKGQRSGISMLLKSLDVYAFSGIGGLSYNVRPNDGLASIGNETSGFTGVIPVGVGANLIFSPELNLGIEIGGRYTFTDNLDCYTSQFSSSNDVYYFLNLTVTYKVRTGSNGLPLFFR